MEIRPILSAMLRNKTAPLLIAAQVALTLAIVCNALYIIRDRLATAARPTGADEQNIFDIRFYPHRPIGDVLDMQRRDMEAIKAVPGVVSATWTNQVPLGMSGWNNGGLTTDRTQQTDISASLFFNGTGDSLVDTFGLRLIEGRNFDDSEFIEVDPELERRTPDVVIVTRALGERLFPDEKTYAGRTFYMGSGDDSAAVRIVGVVERLQSPYAPAADVRAETNLILPTRYLIPMTRYAVRTEPGQQDRVMADVEKALLALRDDRVLLGKRTFVEVRANRYSGENMMAGLLIAVTTFLLLITASGIVGMASLWVNQRRKQIGVRRALGARRHDILRHFVLENVLITTGGVIAGVLLALALNNLLVSELSIPRLPPLYIGITMAVMWVLGLLAVLGPAWRAAAVPPAIATRTA